jgi:hypothetical protein
MRKRIIVSLLLLSFVGYAMERDVELALTASAVASSDSRHIPYPNLYQDSPQPGLSSLQHPHYQPLPTTPSVPPLALAVPLPEDGNLPRRVERAWLSPQGYFIFGACIGAYATFKICLLTSMCNQ